MEKYTTNNKTSFKNFEIGSPVEGIVLSANEYYKIEDQLLVKYGEISQDDALERSKEYDEDSELEEYSNFVSVIPLKGIVKAPFNCTITKDSEIESSCDIGLCADSGLYVTLSTYMLFCEEKDYAFKSELRGGDVVKKGDTLFEFDITKVLAGTPVCIKKVDKLGDNFYFQKVSNKKVSIGDVIAKVEGAPLECEKVEAIINGNAAVDVYLQKIYKRADEELKNTFAESEKVFEGIHTHEDDIENLNKRAGIYIDLLNTLSAYSDKYNVISEQLEYLLYNPSQDNRYNDQIDLVNSLIKNIYDQKQILTKYEKDSQVKYNEIRHELDEKTKFLTELKQDLYKLAESYAADKEVRENFWVDLPQNPKKALINMGLYVVRSMIEDEDKKKK